ncbi:MAG: right-handed parallel beta-helix repeat-containing protein, partial [Candidatus Heimdallarchaeaceae archaeon]
TQNGYRGIYVTGVATGTARIENNTCINNEVTGIQITAAPSSIVYNNTVRDSLERGIFCYGSQNSVISNNSLYDDGLYVADFGEISYGPYIIENNTVNSKELCYYNNMNNTVIDGGSYGQLIITNCENITIINQEISNTYVGITVYNGQNITVFNNTLSRNHHGLSLNSVSYSLITNNTFSSNSYNGLHTRSVIEVDIINNTFYKNREGLSFWGGGQCEISQNQINYSHGTGITVAGLSNSIFRYNYLSNNDDYGINLWDGGSNNLLYGNTFDSNMLYMLPIPAPSQARDYGDNNLWYNENLLTGNKWSNAYSFIEYNIDGLSGSVDIYPIFPDSDNDKIADEWEIIYGLDTNHNDTYLDPDGDLLVNYYEFRNQTDPFDPDTDDDLILDGEEVDVYATNPISSDTDDDNLSDYQEIFTFGTDPLKPDTDGDEMPDGWETNNGLDPLLSDSSLDPDEDSLTNLQEFLYGTDPFVSDTDEDGLTDYEEIFVYETDPTDSDSDRDNLNDGDEVLIYQTNPNSHDSDLDGLNDYNEIMVYGTDPNNRDTDGDGLADGFEITYGFNPLVYSLLPIKNIYLRVGAYVSPFILIILSTISTILIVRRSRRRKLKEYISVQEKDIVSLNKLLMEFNHQDEIALFRFADILTPVVQTLVSNFSFRNNPRKFSKLVKRKISQRFFIEIGFSNLLMELFENFTNSIDKLGCTAIKNEINELEEKILEVKEIDTVYSRLNELKLVLNENKQMID